jgi:iron complex outermembrane receptor protein
MEKHHVRSWWLFLPLLLGGLVLPHSLAAQDGAVAGLVTDSHSGLGLSAVQIEVLRADETLAGSAFTSGRGAYGVTGIRAGTYSVSYSLPGWELVVETGVQVTADQTTRLNVLLGERSFNLNPITVTASKRVEKALDAPAAVETISTEDIAERPATSLTDHVKEKAGVDLVPTGLQTNYVVIRGFNNIFSGQTMTLTDNRIARVPSLRANIAHLNPTTNADIDRVEVVLGPGSALYGPNAANGVIHYLTQSPIDYPGVTLAISNGLRQQSDTDDGALSSDEYVLHGEGRLAFKTDDDRFGLKISGQYFNGEDYDFKDPDELEQQGIAQTCQAALSPTNPACVVFSGDLDLTDPGDLAALGVRVDNVAAGRNNDLERWTLDLRTDIRPTPESSIILSGGRTTAVSSVDLTGIGAGQVVDWGYWYGQGRFTWKDLFGQVFWNKSDNDETYLLRSGRPLVDKSSLLVAQLQHAYEIDERNSLTYGLDFLRTVPRSEGTINGRHEDDDDVTEFGGYVQYGGNLSDRFDLVLAARLDDHSLLDDLVFSPRAALVWRPNNENSIRFTYNRAFSTPTTLNFFLDISAQSIPLGGPFAYDVRAQGVSTDGFTFDRTDGVPDHMSPFNLLLGGSPRQLLPTTTEQLWAEAVALIAANDPTGQAGLLLGLVGVPSAADIPVIAATLDPETAGFVNPTPDLAGIADPTTLKQTTWQTFEVGYKGLLGNQLSFAANGYYSIVDDFVSSLRSFTPNVFLPQAQTQAFLQSRFTPLVGIVFPDQATADATAVALAAAIGQVPLGVIVPPTAGGTTISPILFTYQNLGDFNLFGADVSLTYVMNELWELSGSVAWVEDNIFETGEEDVPLNAPKWKGAATLRYRNSDAGFTAAARGRFVDGFPVASGVYAGEADAYSVFDVNLGWDIPGSQGLTAQLDIQNVFDNGYQAFVGAPELGRYGVLRLIYHH